MIMDNNDETQARTILKELIDQWVVYQVKYFDNDGVFNAPNKQLICGIDGTSKKRIQAKKGMVVFWIGRKL